MYTQLISVSRKGQGRGAEGRGAEGRRGRGATGQGPKGQCPLTDPASNSIAYSESPEVEN